MIRAAAQGRADLCHQHDYTVEPGCRMEGSE